jgi:hypothetical protein
MPKSFLALAGKSRWYSFLSNKDLCKDHWAREILKNNSFGVVDVTAVESTLLSEEGLLPQAERKVEPAAALMLISPSERKNSRLLFSFFVLVRLLKS